MKLKLVSYFAVMACLGITLSVYNGIREARTFRVPRAWKQVATDWFIYRPLYEGRIEHVELGCSPWITVRIDGKYHTFNGEDLKRLDLEKYFELEDRIK